MYYFVLSRAATSQDERRVFMDNSYYFDLFNDYLVNVKKASSNTLSSYLRDIRQFGDYLVSHDLPGYADAGEEELGEYISALRGAGKSVAGRVNASSGAASTRLKS